MANTKNTEVATKAQTALIEGNGLKMTIDNHVVALIAGHAVEPVETSRVR